MDGMCFARSDQGRFRTWRVPGELGIQPSVLGFLKSCRASWEVDIQLLGVGHSPKVKCVCRNWNWAILRSIKHVLGGKDMQQTVVGLLLLSRVSSESWKFKSMAWATHQSSSVPRKTWEFEDT